MLFSDLTVDFFLPFYLFLCQNIEMVEAVLSESKNLLSGQVLRAAAIIVSNLLIQSIFRLIISSFIDLFSILNRLS